MAESILKLYYYGSPFLRKKSEPVKDIDDNVRTFIKSMYDTMHHYKGIGLAAPQVGINEQIFVYDIGEGPNAVINPQIIKKAGSWELEEGCLSIPGVIVNVKRPYTVGVRYFDEYNNVVECEYSDLMSRVFLHESDHLVGKLMIDYAGWREKGKINQQLAKITSKYGTQS